MVGKDKGFDVMGCSKWIELKGRKGEERFWGGWMAGRTRVKAGDERE